MHFHAYIYSASEGSLKYNIPIRYIYSLFEIQVECIYMLLTAIYIYIYVCVCVCVCVCMRDSLGGPLLRQVWKQYESSENVRFSFCITVEHNHGPTGIYQ